MSLRVSERGIFVFIVAPFLAAALALALVVASSTIWHGTVAAQTDRFVATDGSDADNDCADEANPCATMQHAIDEAGDGDTINVAAGIYTEPGLFVNREVTIHGAGPEATIIQADENPGAATGPAMTLVAEVTTVVGVTLRHGNVTGNGGGIFVDAGRVFTLGNSVVSNNDATENGGGIFANFGATVTITNSTVEGNSAEHGGGIYSNGGTVTLTGSTVSGNAAEERGGGIYNNGGEVTVTGSSASANEALRGGGIYNDSGTVTLINSTIGGSSPGDGNSSTSEGGGIRNAGGGQVTVIDSSISGNDGSPGGGIYSHDGPLSLEGSTVSGNSASPGDGGGIYIGGGASVTLNRSTVSDNSALPSGYGGGIFIDLEGLGSTHLINSTVSGNTAGHDGGGIYLHAGSVTLTNVTVSENEVIDEDDEGGGIYILNGTVTMTNTIIAAQQSGGDCGGETPDSDGHNLDSDGSCGLTAAGDISEGDANLGPLSDNGGPTLTHALLEGSDAIDAGDDAVCQAPPVNGVDQRGAFRPHGKACDIGAFEFGAAVPLWGDIDCDGAVVIGDALKTARYLLSLSVSQEAGCPEPGAEVTANGVDRTWGDVDCDGSVAIGDALKIARWLLGLAVSQEEGCPEIGTEVAVGEA